MGGNFVMAVSWSPFGDLVATGSDDRKLRIVDAVTGHVRNEVQHAGRVLAVSWSQLGDLVATGSHDGKLRIVEAATGQVRCEMLHGSLVPAVSWCPSGHLVATGSFDKKLRIIEAATGQPQYAARCCAEVGLRPYPKVAAGSRDMKFRQ